jgi:membrane associated rhomboid family serine protease
VNPLPRTLDSFDRFNFFNFKISGCTGPVRTIQPLTILQVFGIRLALVASISAMSDFANNVLGGLALSAAFGGLIIGALLIVLAFVPPRNKANR